LVWQPDTRTDLPSEKGALFPFILQGKGLADEFVEEYENIKDKDKLSGSKMMNQSKG